MDYTALRVTKKDGVAEIQFCRPEVMNRFDSVLFDEFSHALPEVARDPEVRAILLTSTGKCFSAGGDTDHMLAVHADVNVCLHHIDEGRRLFRMCADLTKPLVVALHGDTFGVSTTIAMTADALVAAPKVKIADPHVRLGLVAGDGGCVTWPMNLPAIKARRHLLWGEPLTGEEAYQLGMVTDLVDTPEEVIDRARELAERVATLPPLAVQLTKRTLNKATAGRTDEVLDTGFYLEAITAASDDLVEAVSAFKEKRTGNWTGR